jgi:hypothetical protein
VREGEESPGERTRARGRAQRDAGKRAEASEARKEGDGGFLGARPTTERLGMT